MGPKSKSVNAVIDRLLTAFGPELAILRDVPAEELARIGGSPLTEAITRLRRGEVIKDAGYDGEYGRIRLFRSGELNRSGALFDVPGQGSAARAAGPAGHRNGPAGRSQAGSVSGRGGDHAGARAACCRCDAQGPFLVPWQSSRPGGRWMPPKNDGCSSSG